VQEVLAAGRRAFIFANTKTEIDLNKDAILEQNPGY
jgi:hypothetical protein